MSNARQLAANLPREGGLSNRNLLINNEFKVNQRGVTSVTGYTGPGAFTADRWISYASTGITSTISIQGVTLPNGVRTQSHKTECTAGSGGWLHPFQKVESLGLDYLKGKTITLSAWVKTNMANQKVRFCDGTACHLIGDDIPNDGEWHFISVNHTMRTDLLTGSTNFMQFHPAFTASGTPVVVGSYIEFALPQMEIGSSATPFEYEPISVTLQKCQRYYQRITGETQSGGATADRGIFMGHTWSSISQYWVHHFVTPMRAGPSAGQSHSTTSLGTWYSGGSTANPAINLAIQAANGTRAEMYCTLNSTLPAGNGSWFRLSGDSYWVDFDAEL